MRSLSILKKRRSQEELEDYKEIIDDMRESQFLKRMWERYQEENTYSADIGYTDVLDTVLEIGLMLEQD